MFHRQGVLPLASAIAVALLNQACASSGAVKAAERGDYAALKQALATEKAAGSIDGGEARAVARAVANFELTAAKGADGVARVDELGMCAPQVQSLLEKRAKDSDEAAARAAYFLLNDHLNRPGKWVDRASSEDPAWRAVGARALVSSSNGERRRELFLDVFTAVRKSAVEASVDATDREDEALLLDAVRVDPEPQIRMSAARAVGLLGGEGAVSALKDRWAPADEPLRVIIVGSWGAAPSYRSGGREQLYWAAETEKGAPSVAAAALLLKGPEQDVQIGRGALLRAIDDGGPSARVMAINLADLADAPQKDAIVRASSSPEPLVKVAALSRLTEQGEQHDKVVNELAEIAAAEGLGRNPARTALAKARDRRVVELLAQDAQSSEPGVRAWAAAQLASMKEYPHAAQVLADDEVSVRIKAACAILTMPKLGRSCCPQVARLPPGECLAFCPPGPSAPSRSWGRRAASSPWRSGGRSRTPGRAPRLSRPSTTSRSLATRPTPPSGSSRPCTASPPTTTPPSSC